MTVAPAPERGHLAEGDPDTPPCGLPERLSEAVRAFSDPGYAVLDGGLFDDLPASLRRVGLFARSLFLDHADSEVEKAGPWLVALDQGDDTLVRVGALVGNRPAAVFWSCPGDDMVLHRHLRTLNMVRIPTWAAGGEAEPSAEDGFEVVMFRHWDPRVLGSLLPVLDAGQFARVVGPAGEVAFWADDDSGLRRVPRDEDWPPAAPGMLTIGSAQVEALNGRRLDASRRRIVAYLRETAPVMTEHATDGQLLSFVRESERHGRALGLESEAAYGRWAYLMLRNEGRILQTPRAGAFIGRAGRHPDEQVRVLLAQTAPALRRHEDHQKAGGGR